MGEGVDDGRLLLAGDHQAGALVELEIAGDGAEPLVDIAVISLLGAVGRAQAGGQRPGELLDVGGAQRQPVVGLGSRGGGGGLDDVQPVHLGLVAADAPARRELAGIAQEGGAGSEKIGIERNDDLGVGEVVPGVDRLAEGLDRGGAGAVRPGGIPLVPLGGGEELLNGAELLRHGGRGDRFR